MNPIQPLHWKTTEYDHKERSNDWIWGIGILALAGAIVSIYFGNYVFGIFILLSGFMLIFLNTRQPHEFEITISKDGIKVDNELFVYKNIKGFALKEDIKTNLLIETSKYFLPIVTIPAPDHSANSIRATLVEFIPEIEIEESKSVKFAEKLGI